jgi:hypothetical protein
MRRFQGLKLSIQCVIGTIRDLRLALYIVEIVVTTNEVSKFFNFVKDAGLPVGHGRALHSWVR